MTERIPTKWAIDPTPVATSLDAIRDATTDERLLERAMCDFVMEFAGFIVDGKTARQAIAELDCWRSWLATVREHGK
jgi:hypothetical protein